MVRVQQKKNGFFWGVFVGAVMLFLAFYGSTAVAADRFVPLVGIPGVDPNSEIGLVGYLNALYILSVSLGALFAVIKIGIAGVKYSMGDVITDKESAKKDIYGALFGLAILLATYVVLNTINPQLTNLNILESAQPSPPPPPGAEVSGIDPSWATGEMDGTGAATSGTTRDPNAINCPQGQLKFRYTNGTLGCGTGHGSGFNVTGAQAAAAAEDCRSVEGTFQVRSIVGSGPQYVCSW